MNNNKSDNIKKLKEEYEKLKKIRAEQIIPEVLKSNCTLFCPRYEQLNRILNNEVDKYETEIMIKKYVRSGSGSVIYPEDIRDINTLKKTFEYLITIEINKNSFEFLENRIRALQGDIRAQFIYNEEKVIEILELIIRWYIYSIYKLYDENEINLNIIITQGRKTLLTLLSYYEKNELNYKNNIENTENIDLKKQKLSNFNQNIEEFYSYYILFNLNESVFFEKMKCNKLYNKQALKIAFFYQSISFDKFFRIVSDFGTMCLIYYWRIELLHNVMKIFQKGINEKIQKIKIDEILGIDSKYLLKSYFYEGDEINFRNKNESGMEIQRNKWGKYKNSIKFIKLGNYDFKIYKKLIILIIENKIEKIKLFNLVIKKTCDELLKKVKNKLFLRKILRRQIYEDSIIEIIKKILYQISVKKFFKKKLNFSDKILVVMNNYSKNDKFSKNNYKINNKTIKNDIKIEKNNYQINKFIYRTDEYNHKTNKLDKFNYDKNYIKMILNLDDHILKYFKYFTKKISFDQLNENMALKYNLVIFLIEENFIDFINEKYYFLNYLINPEIHKINLELINTKVIKIKLSEILYKKNIKEQIKIILNIRKFLDNYKEIIECILEKKYYKDKIIYYKLKN